MLKFRVVRQIVEGKLAEYAARVHEEPPVPISSVYEAPSLPPKKGRHGPSLPERWVMSREDVIAFGRLISALPELEQRVVRLYYIDGKSWKVVERELSMHRNAIFQVRDRAIAMLAAWMGISAPAAPAVQAEGAQVG